ncbi:tyrosine-protein phosphatase [Cohnella sp. 56]|uniref:tyrosine-protein phosphatase n=1 Tax=Cohnella sp. 56 TaxID=3113722 RepID=UPI0030E75D01
MIDTHSHILPYCDDGAGNWRQAEQMARQAAAQGVKIIVATPHHRKGIFLNRPSHIQSLVTRLNKQLSDAKIPIHICTGQEYHMTSMIMADLASGEIQSVERTKYILVELSSRNLPKLVLPYLRVLKSRGLIPIIVHPERYEPVIENLSLLSGWLREGAFFQLTAGSLTGQFGPAVQRTAYTIAEYNLAHLLASDAHDTSQRSNRLGQAYEMLEKEFGRELSDRLKNNASLLLQNQPLLIGVPKRLYRAKWYEFSFIK